MASCTLDDVVGILFIRRRVVGNEPEMLGRGQYCGRPASDSTRLDDALAQRRFWRHKARQSPDVSAPDRRQRAARTHDRGSPAIAQLDDGCRVRGHRLVSPREGGRPLRSPCHSARRCGSQLDEGKRAARRGGVQRRGPGTVVRSRRRPPQALGPIATAPLPASSLAQASHNGVLPSPRALRSHVPRAEDAERRQFAGHGPSAREADRGTASRAARAVDAMHQIARWPKPEPAAFPARLARPSDCRLGPRLAGCKMFLGGASGQSSTWAVSDDMILPFPEPCFRFAGNEGSNDQNEIRRCGWPSPRRVAALRPAASLGADTIVQAGSRRHCSALRQNAADPSILWRMIVQTVTCPRSRSAGRAPSRLLAWLFIDPGRTTIAIAPPRQQQKGESETADPSQTQSDDLRLRDVKTHQEFEYRVSP